MHDLGIILDIGRRGNCLSKGGKIGDAAFAVAVCPLCDKRIHERYGIHALARKKHALQSVKDLFMLVEIKILRMEDARHLGKCLGLDENGTENCLLGFERHGQLSQKIYSHF